MLTEKTFDTGELTLNYAEGPSSGAPMVLLHGATMWWHAWEAMIPQLEANWHLYAVDLRGHGKSGRSGDHYYVADYARDIIAFLRSIGQPVVLVGHSLGALTTLAVAAQAPELVRAIVPLDPPIGLAVDIEAQPETKAWFQRARDMVLAAPTYEAMLALLSKQRKTPNDGRTEQMARMVSSLAPEVMDILMSNRLFGDIDRADMLEHITAPTLMLVADFSAGGAMRRQDIDFVREHLHGVTIREFPGADHQLELNHPTEMVEAIESFLQTHPI